MDARLSRYSYLVSLLPESVVDDLELQFVCRRRPIASCTPYERPDGPAALILSNVDQQLSRSSFDELAGEADWRGYQRLVELQHAFATRVWPGLLQPLKTRGEWKASLQTPLEREAWDAFVEQPLGEAIERYVQNDVVRGLIFTDAKIGLLTHPHDPTLLQNRCFILHVIGRGTGEWLVPVGGMGALVGALTHSATRAGAQLVTGAPVEAVSPGASHHTVFFRHDGKELAVDATRVLINAGPQVFARLLETAYEPDPGDEGSVCKVNMLLRRLPRLKAKGIEPRDAFAGTFHIDQAYRQMQESYRQAFAGELPIRPPSEIYCHTLTDDSILGPELRAAAYHTLTLFGLDAPHGLFERDNDAVKKEILRRYLASLDRIVDDPIEDCLARDENGELCIEVKSPLDLEHELTLNRGNIFHQAPSWFFADPECAGDWGVETPYERIYLCGSSALRGGAVSGIPGHNAAQRIFQELRIATPAGRA
jgi:phytoene dehydrogenase-like protein